MLVAHLSMARLVDDQLRALLKTYQPPEGFDFTLFAGFAGAEVFRRLLGLAQLPVDLTLDEKQNLVTWARSAVMQPERGAFGWAPE